MKNKEKTMYIAHCICQCFFFKLGHKTESSLFQIIKYR